MVRGLDLGRRRRRGDRKLIFSWEQRTLSVAILHPSFCAISSAFRPSRSIIAGIKASTAFVKIFRPITALLLSHVGKILMELIVPGAELVKLV
jgi:hypothetical protein